ncbi:HSP20-like chaperone [Suillus placidus]|uniref:HSP20-like chaperone n=1 Tax=Suillus placidus TaxID=48579 RepID=A0A9P7D341_9AGAM|nr:HSP20-like chaperone [Suillus placidus]
MTTHPEVLWAQRSSDSVADKNIVWLTVNVPDIDETSLQYKLTSTDVSFKAESKTDQRAYAFSLPLFDEVDTEASLSKLSSRSFTAVLRKKALNTEYWPRLTKEKTKPPFVKTDFSKWVDEDEQDGAPLEEDFGGMEGMGGMGGMGMGGMDFSKMMASMGGGAGDPSGTGDEPADSDSDDDGPPPLEDAEPSA